MSRTIPDQVYWDSVLSPADLAPFFRAAASTPFPIPPINAGPIPCARLMWLFKLYFSPNIIPQTRHRNGFSFRCTLLKCRLRFWARELPRKILLQMEQVTCTSYSKGRRRGSSWSKRGRREATVARSRGNREDGRRAPEMEYSVTIHGKKLQLPISFQSFATECPQKVWLVSL